MMKSVKLILNWALSILWAVGMIWSFACPCSRILLSLVGLAGLFYCGTCLCLFLLRPVQRDWLMVRGPFLHMVINFVMLMPFVFNFIVEICHFIAGGDPVLSYFLVSDADRGEVSLFWSIFFHFVDPGNQHMAVNNQSRSLAALFAMCGIFLLNGLLVSTIIGWFDRRKEQWRNGEVRYSLSDLGKYRFAVVIGANEIAASVIKNLLVKPKKNEINFRCEGDNKYVILQTSRNVQEVRNELESHLSEDNMRKVVIYSALRDSKSDIEEHLHLEYSTEIYVLGESTVIGEGESFHDALNMKCVNMIADILNETHEKRIARKAKTGISVRKVCKVMFEYQTTHSVFQFSDIRKEIRDNLVFIPFNRYESWARKVIVEGSAKIDSSVEDDANNKITYIPLDGYGIKEESDECVHFVVVGMSPMGVAMGIQAMLHAHYLNYKRSRTRISFIDANADKEMDFIKGRYDNLFQLTRHRYVDSASCAETQLLYDSGDWIDPMTDEDCPWKHLSPDGKNFIDIEIEFIKGTLESAGVRKYLQFISDDNDSKVRNSKLTVAICLTQTHEAVAASVFMPLSIYKKAQQIWVYQREAADIILNFSNTGAEDLRYKKLVPFGMIYGEYMSDRRHFLSSMLINVAYDIVNGYKKVDGKRIDWPKNLRDKADENFIQARLSWKDLSEDKKWSNKYCADSFYLKIKNALLGDRRFMTQESVWSQLKEDRDSAMFTICSALFEKQAVLAVVEHNRWNIQQLLMGYSPSDEELDKIFEEKNKNADSDEIQEKYKKWKQKNGLDSSNIMTEIKMDVKSTEIRIHPNICAFEHLEIVDNGAHKYDIDINNSIPKIISLVSGYNEICCKKNRCRQ